MVCIGKLLRSIPQCLVHSKQHSAFGLEEKITIFILWTIFRFPVTQTFNLCNQQNNVSFTLCHIFHTISYFHFISGKIQAYARNCCCFPLSADSHYHGNCLYILHFRLSCTFMQNDAKTLTIGYRETKTDATVQAYCCRSVTSLNAVWPAHCERSSCWPNEM